MSHLARVRAGRRLGVPLLAALALACTACGGPSAVTGEQLARQVSDQLTEQVGQKPDKVSCPDDLEAEKGASSRCALTDSGQSYGVTVTTTGVDGDTVRFHVQVDKQPTS